MAAGRRTTARCSFVLSPNSCNTALCSFVMRERSGNATMRSVALPLRCAVLHEPSVALHLRAVEERLRNGVALRSSLVESERSADLDGRSAVLTVRVGEVPMPAGAGPEAAVGMPAESVACYGLSGVFPVSFR